MEEPSVWTAKLGTVRLSGSHSRNGVRKQRQQEKSLNSHLRISPSALKENMSLDDLLNDLRKTYLAALPDRIALIESLLEKHQYPLVETEFHKLKGTGKTYGLPEISQVGEVTERLCENGTTTADESVPTALKLLKKIFAARTAGQPVSLENDPDFLYLTELATEIHDTTSGKRNQR